MFLFFRKFVSNSKYEKRSKFPVIVTLKHADVLNDGLFRKSLVLFFRKAYALYVGFTCKKKRFPVLRQKSVQILP